MVDFRAILTHELWHLAFLEHQRRHWPRDYRESADPRALFFHRMLNEGVGHYYSMHHRLHPSPRWPVHALTRELGPGRVQQLIASEPFSVFLAYEKLSRGRSSWPGLSPSMVADARQALDAHHAALRGR